MIKTALIGTSGYAGLHLQNLLRLQEIRKVSLDAVLIKNSAEALGLTGIESKVFRENDAFFDYISGKVDLCCIPTSIQSHAELSIKAMQAGCHVLVEKPAAATVSAIDDMIRVSESLDKSVFVGYQDLYSPSTWHIKRLLLEGVIGELKSASLLGLWPRAKQYFVRNDWAGKVSLGNEWIYDSVLHNAFGHFLNLMAFWAGDTLDMPCAMQKVAGNLYRAMPIESFDTCSIEVETTKGKKLYANLSHVTKKAIDPVIELLGSEGSIRWTVDSYTVNGQETLIAKDTDEALDLSRSTMFNNVISQLNGIESHTSSLKQARITTEVVNSLHQKLPILTINESLLEAYQNELGDHLAVKNLDSQLIDAHYRHALMAKLPIPAKTIS